ncbi:hypothetical protein QQ215_003450 [Vibrio vulnificus]|uniref:hypothetical protein n=1 Tax=Vibrio vulnificus TaxID=672 RepID=UPI001A20A2EA|nr:hypothetical protein [Vibrio vulnificus]EIO4105159.1 hypothetical protein [Vibrio vulnificus]ELC9717423.1 hypothetical protein [Vibrio vulnificus]ELS0762702.1 hypothetical protein [Vibrio vulnificus]ELV8609324.1 hypothetical protein [Vibrio vulnificus]ELV8618280.1 hypothetical protein [Vibrio vulnificus]
MEIRGEKVPKLVIVGVLMIAVAQVHFIYLSVTSLSIEEALVNVTQNTKYTISSRYEREKFGLEESGVLGIMYDCIIQSDTKWKSVQAGKKSKIKTSGRLLLELEDIDITLNFSITDGNATKLIVSGVDENGNSLNVSPAYLKCPLSLLNEKNH